jgi:hypothetical protein
MLCDVCRPCSGWTDEYVVVAGNKLAMGGINARNSGVVSLHRVETV